MPLIQKLLSLASIGNLFASASASHRFVAELTNLLVLTLIGTLMGGILLVAIFVAIYFALVQYGVEPFTAALSIALVMLVIMGGVFLVVAARIRTLRDVAIRQARIEHPLLTRATSIGRAFTEGLRGEPAPRERRK